jgi:hypothetical protein
MMHLPCRNINGIASCRNLVPGPRIFATHTDSVIVGSRLSESSTWTRRSNSCTQSASAKGTWRFATFSANDGTGPSSICDVAIPKYWSAVPPKVIEVSVKEHLPHVEYINAGPLRGEVDERLNHFLFVDAKFDLVLHRSSDSILALRKFTAPYSESQRGPPKRIGIRTQSLPWTTSPTVLAVTPCGKSQNVQQCVCES